MNLVHKQFEVLIQDPYFWLLLKTFFSSFCLGGTILRCSVTLMSNVQTMEYAEMGCGELTVHACQVLQAAGKVTFKYILVMCKQDELQ